MLTRKHKTWAKKHGTIEHKITANGTPKIATLSCLLKSKPGFSSKGDLFREFEISLEYSVEQAEVSVKPVAASAYVCDCEVDNDCELLESKGVKEEIFWS